MKKNSDFKNISYTNYEIVSIFIVLLSCVFISYSPIRIIDKCGSASVIGMFVIGIITYIIYYFILNQTFKNEYDMFEIIKKTYTPFWQKVFGIIIFLMSLLYIYITISDLLYNLKASVYTKSTIFSLSIFFIVAMYFLGKKGFNTIFRIVGYISYIIVIYIIFLFAMAFFKINIYNYFPILGNGFEGIFKSILINIGIFSPLFYLTFFGGNVVNNKKRKVYKNFNIIMIIFTLMYALLIFTFIGTVPVEIISSRYTLLLDLTSLIASTPISINLSPIMIFVFSFLIFISSAFSLLCGLYNIQRLNIVKDYSKYLLPSVIILTITFLFPISFLHYAFIVYVFYFLAIGIAFVFPIVTLIIYKIKYKGGTNKFKQNKNMEDVIEEVE